MYKDFELMYGDNPQHNEDPNGWNKKAWLSFIDDEYICTMDSSKGDWAWNTVFTAIGVPETFHSRLREYKALLGRISFCNADDHGGDWKLVPPIRDKAQALADELIDEDGALESVIDNLKEGELL